MRKTIERGSVLVAENYDADGGDVLPVIDSIIGLAFVFSFLSLVCSAIREAGENLLMKRPASLRATLHRMLGTDTAELVYRHPMVAGLGDQPSYIPARTFSSTLLDLVRNGAPIPDHLGATLRALSGTRAGEEGLEDAVEHWFNAAMDAASLAYKRHTHAWLAVIGLGVAVFTNADSIRMTTALFQDAGIRTAAVEAGERIAAGPAPSASTAVGELRSFGMPLGWSGETRDNGLPWKQPWTGPWWANAWALFQWHWAGWLFTVAAIHLGAPFWFDVLRRCVPLRGFGHSDDAPHA